MRQTVITRLLKGRMAPSRKLLHCSLDSSVRLTKIAVCRVKDWCSRMDKTGVSH